MGRRPAPQGRPVRDRRVDAVRPVGELTPVVLVDGENVRRSRWPNLTRDELVDRCAAWAGENDVDAIVVFDGGPTEERLGGERCVVVGSAAETADEAIERRAGALAAEGRRYWLVTSDRALRAAAGGAAERTIGGGAFLRELLEG